MITEVKTFAAVPEPRRWQLAATAAMPAQSLPGDLA
jgi:hypothetical protein